MSALAISELPATEQEEIQASRRALIRDESNRIIRMTCDIPNSRFEVMKALGVIERTCMDLGFYSAFNAMTKKEKA